METSESIRHMSDELARNPSSDVFLPLGEALRRNGQIDMAQRVAQKGLERNPQLADAHDLMARVYVDRRDFERAFDEWDTVVRLSPGHLGALKGMGFICYQRERLTDAERYLALAAASDPDDEAVESALRHVRSAQRALAGAESEPAPVTLAEDSRDLFANALSDEGQIALLLDAQGLVIAGAYMSPEGVDIGQEIGAELSGVTDAARRATRHLDLGDWTSIVFETEQRVVALAPAPGDGLLVLATTRDTPLGLARRLLDKCADVASRWLRGIG